MFDFENHFKEAADLAEENEVLEEATPTDWENAEWEGITDAHATAEEASGRADARMSHEATAARIYRKVNARRRERTVIASIRYAMLALGLTAVAWLVRDITGLAITLGGIALCFALIAAYGAGKCHEM